LPVDVVDDVVGADQHAGAALAAAAVGHHLVHHLLEGDLRHPVRTLAQAPRQRKRRGGRLAGRQAVCEDRFMPRLRLVAPILVLALATLAHAGARRTGWVGPQPGGRPPQPPMYLSAAAAPP